MINKNNPGKFLNQRPLYQNVKISVLFFIWNKKEAKVCEVGLVKRKKIPLDSSRVYLCIGLAADIAH